MELASGTWICTTAHNIHHSVPDCLDDAPSCPQLSPHRSPAREKRLEENLQLVVEVKQCNTRLYDQSRPKLNNRIPRLYDQSRIKCYCWMDNSSNVGRVNVISAVPKL